MGFFDDVKKTLFGSDPEPIHGIPNPFQKPDLGFLKEKVALNPKDASQAESDFLNRLTQNIMREATADAARQESGFARRGLSGAGVSSDIAEIAKAQTLGAGRDRATDARLNLGLQSAQRDFQNQLAAQQLELQRRINLANLLSSNFLTGQAQSLNQGVLPGSPGAINELAGGFGEGFGKSLGKKLGG